MRQPIRAPRPHLTTARATRKARTISKIVPLAKPAYAFAGDSRPVSTDAATASTDAVRIGKALTTTEAMAAANTMNRRHAGSARPSGAGTNHMATAIATTAIRVSRVRRSVSAAVAAVVVTAVVVTAC